MGKGKGERGDDALFLKEGVPGLGVNTGEVSLGAHGAGTIRGKTIDIFRSDSTAISTEEEGTGLGEYHTNVVKLGVQGAGKPVIARWTAMINEGTMEGRDRKAYRAELRISGIIDVDGIGNKGVRGREERVSSPSSVEHSDGGGEEPTLLL